MVRLAIHSDLWHKLVKMRHFIIILCFLLFRMNASRAEMIDYSDSRQDYARAISQLGQSGNAFSKPLLNGTQEKPILVLFRTRKGTPSFGEYEPEVLVSGPHGCFTAAYPNRSEAVAAIRYLNTLSDVLYAELDGEVSATDGINDSDLLQIENSGNQHAFHSYGASEMGFGQASEWCERVGTGSVTVAVIDSGVYPHSFLSARLKSSGFDYVDADEDATNDPYGHGTHVAGIIVDCTPELSVYIRAIRVLNESGKGSVANTTSAIFEAAEAGCDIINLSLVSDIHSNALEDAVRFALNNGSTVVIAAGNNGQDTQNYCPVHMQDSGLIVVGACTGSLASPKQAAYSNYGSSVDVFAFGSSIESCASSGGYVSKSGTSQAAPHVSALSSIIRLLFPSISNGQVESKAKALATAGKLSVPNAALLVPKTIGVSTREIYLPTGTQIQLLEDAVPETSFIHISWYSDNESVARIDGSALLSCLAEGDTYLNGDGPANADTSIALHVFDDHLLFQIPEAVVVIESEAFSGTKMKAVRLPLSIEALATDVFAQSELKTIFYKGNQNLFGELCGKEICIITDENTGLWQELRDAEIPYMIFSN